MLHLPVVDEAKCDGCGLCVGVCRCGILVMGNGVVSVVPRKKCIDCNCWCRLCESVCPVGAITCPFEIILEEEIQIIIQEGQ